MLPSVLSHITKILAVSGSQAFFFPQSQSIIKCYQLTNGKQLSVYYLVIVAHMSLLSMKEA